MGKLFLDLKKFKATQDDGKVAIFEHSDGHQVHVSKSALTPAMRAQLEELTKNKMTKGGRATSMLRTKYEGPANPKLAESKKMADGGAVDDDNSKKTVGQIIGYPGSDPSPTPSPSPKTPQNFDDGGEVTLGNLDPNSAQIPDTTPPPAAADQPFTGVGGFSASDAPYGTPPTLPTADSDAIPETKSGGDDDSANASAAQSSPSKDIAQPPADAAPPTDQGSNPYSTAPYQDAMRQAQALPGAFNTENAAVAKQAQAQEIAQQNIANQFQQNYKARDEDFTKFADDVNKGMIDPKHYLHDMGAGSKIATAFGLIAGGIGGAITGQGNPAMDFLNKQIDRDISAQERNLGAKQSLLSANLSYHKDRDVALADTAAQQRAVYAVGLQKAAAQAGNPQAKANLLNASVSLMNQARQGIFQSSMLQTLKQNAGSTNDIPGQIQAWRMMGNESQANNLQSRYLPGTGAGGKDELAKEPVPQQTRDQLVAMSTLDAKGRDLLNFIDQNRGTWNPQKRAIATQKAEEMKNFYNASIGGGALTEGRLNWYDEQFTKHPTDIIPQLLGSTAKLKEMVNSNASRRDILRQQTGLPPLASPQSNGPAIGSKVVNKSTGEVRQWDGKAYSPVK